MAKKKRELGKAEQIRYGWFQKLVDFGLLLAQRREQLGLSQSEMAKRIGTSQSRISRIEMGCGTPKDFPTAQAYAVSYQLDEQETNAWFQLVFGITQSHQDTHEQQSLTINQATILPNSEFITHWDSIVGTRLIQIGQELQDNLLWADVIPLFRKAEMLLGVTSQAAIAACKTAHMYVELGDYDQALEEVRCVQGTYAAVMNPEIAMEIARTRGWIDYDQGNFAQAVPWFDQCLSIAAEADMPRLSTHAHHFLGRVYCDWGRILPHRKQAAAWFHKAAEHFDMAYILHQTWGDQGDRAYDLFRRAQLLQAQRKWRDAQRLRNRARAMSDKELIVLNIDLEEARLALRDSTELYIPQSKAETALRGWAQVKRAKGMADALHILGCVHSLQGKFGQALELSVVALCLYPFEHHLDNQRLRREIEVLAGEIIREHDKAYYVRLVNHFQDQAASRLGYFSYLDHVVADRSADMARIFGRLY